ncbi:unnamed protein product [Diamesa hyperborea]
MIRQRSSMRSSRGSTSTTESDPKEKVKDCCRKLVAFMCTQVGVGGLIVGYAIVGAFGFMHIELAHNNTQLEQVESLRRNCAAELWDVTETYNLFNESAWFAEADLVMRMYQDNLTDLIKGGYDPRTPEEIWTFSAALMFCLSIFTMIGYGNTLPKTVWGKVSTMVYATFGIPLYILYFMNMGKVLASTFRWLYTWFHECSRDKDDDYSAEDGGLVQRKRIIVPSTACLWVISFYIAGGTIMFAEWEHWNYLDSVYFCVISLCKIGFGDYTPGANLKDSEAGKQSKLVMNFIFILFGMGLVAMCYILMREEVRVKMREIKEDTKLCLEDLSQRFQKCCGGGNKDDEFEDKYY